jgi:hypothetical protein
MRGGGGGGGERRAPPNNGKAQLCVLLLPWGLLYIGGGQLVSQEERAKRSKGISPKRRQKGEKIEQSPRQGTTHDP